MLSNSFYFPLYLDCYAQLRGLNNTPRCPYCDCASLVVHFLRDASSCQDIRMEVTTNANSVLSQGASTVKEEPAVLFVPTSSVADRLELECEIRRQHQLSKKTFFGSHSVYGGSSSSGYGGGYGNTNRRSSSSSISNLHHRSVHNSSSHIAGLSAPTLSSSASATASELQAPLPPPLPAVGANHATINYAGGTGGGNISRPIHADAYGAALPPQSGVETGADEDEDAALLEELMLIEVNDLAM
jgi:hypothetical protein